MQIHNNWLAALAVFLGAVSPGIPQDTCISGSTLCNPTEAKSTIVPQIGNPEFRSLYQNIVQSSLPTSKHSLGPRSNSSLCCSTATICITVTNLRISFCYDKYTTDYFLPDGSHGRVVGGLFASEKNVTNFIVGDFKLQNGTKGTRYSDNTASKPHITAPPMPTKFNTRSTSIENALSAWVTITYTSMAPISTEVSGNEGIAAPSVTKETYPLVFLVRMKDSTRDPRVLLPYVVFESKHSESVVSGTARYQWGGANISLNGTATDPENDPFWSTPTQDALPTAKKKNRGSRERGWSLKLMILEMVSLLLLVLLL